MSFLAKQEQEIVYSAMRTIENASCIVFKNHTNEDNWVKFTKQGGYAILYLRVFRGMVTLEGGLGCTYLLGLWVSVRYAARVGVILYELMNSY